MEPLSKEVIAPLIFLAFSISSLYCALSFTPASALASTSMSFDWTLTRSFLMPSRSTLKFLYVFCS